MYTPDAKFFNADGSINYKAATAAANAERAKTSRDTRALVAAAFAKLFAARQPKPATVRPIHAIPAGVFQN